MNPGQIAIIAGVVGIIAIILVLVLMSYQESEEENYKPLPKEWQISGPFQIDRSEYAIGEKIFMVANGLEFDERGEIVIMRPLNATHQSAWDAIPFDGAAKPEFRLYVEPKLSKIDGFCSVDDIIGKWLLVFNGTSYPPLEFNIDKRVVPGTNTEPVC